MAVSGVLHFSLRDSAVFVAVPVVKLPLNLSFSDYVIPVVVEISEQSPDDTLLIELVSRHDLHFVTFAILTRVVSTAFVVFCMRQEPFSLYCGLAKGFSSSRLSNGEYKGGSN